MTRQTLAARAALLGVLASALWAAAVLSTGGFDLWLGPLSLRSHTILAPLVLLLLSAVVSFAAGGSAVRDELRALSRLSTAFAIAAAAAAFTIAVRWGTDAAGGSDSYCYLSQARLFASGALRIEQPWVDALPWADAARAAVPAGYTGVAGHSAIAPMCPAGLALLMALLFSAAGDRGMLLVVPLLGAWGVWLTYRAGTRITSRGAAACAAIALAASPIFLYQVVQPMSDVPAMAFWMATVCLACGPITARRAALTGLSAAAALTMRPNLLPIAIVIGLWLTAAAREAPATRRLAIVASYAACLFLGIVFVAVMQWRMYGSPLRSGYAALDVLFRVRHAVPNLQRYPTWLVDTHTAAVALAPIAPFLHRDRSTRLRRWLLFVVAVTNFGAYIFYTPFDDWWYLRFLLPAIPCLILLVAAVADDVLNRFGDTVRVAVAVVGVFVAASWYAHVAERRGVFRLRAAESRFIATGRYLASSLPEHAIVITAFQSGSVRYYSGRRTLAWDALSPQIFDAVVAGLSARGESPVMVLENWEEPRFRAAFSGASQLADLDWPPRAQIGREVRVYDPVDRARYFAGERVPTERIWIGERR